MSTCGPELFAFLSGTLDKEGNCSPLRVLQGHGDVLRIIFQMACSEWWDANIIPFAGVDEETDTPIRHLLPWGARWRNQDEPSLNNYPDERQDMSGCPAAILEEDIDFPPPTFVPMGTFKNQTTEQLYVNMMPIYVHNEVELNASLPPSCCHYLNMIKLCLRRLQLHKINKPKLGFLTIDERLVEKGQSQRRGGLHVESPGWLPTPYEMPGRNDVYIPGAEHHWGNGIMMREELIKGGIFMASNISNSCAVWNCHVHDPSGDVIGLHGDIRHLQDLLGSPALALQARTLVWMTDKTPHESLPVLENCHRQYFRLVVGDVTSWFADHSTPNPLWSSGYHENALSHINIVHGNKFEIYKNVEHIKWKIGSVEEIRAAHDFKQFCQILYMYGLGHMAQEFKANAITSLKHLLDHIESRGMEGIREMSNIGFFYYESHKLNDLFHDLRGG